MDFTQQNEIIIYQPDETLKLNVRVESDTVWLTQMQIVELFISSKANISEHIKHIFETGELQRRNCSEIPNSSKGGESKCNSNNRIL